ncbi:glyoxalase domain-containing protein 4-like [Ornithodoros turicata]|uniref:Putative glyoxalase n=1 Tax=Ornithodoros turicata TaxID=34597 RepID=A0A2R5LGC2_9ACAR
MVRRALHFVFKVGDRTNMTKFVKEVLGMKPLRHEEFEEGCRASCNGPYDLNWSKTMVGYGPEDSHFVLELTYNYGIGGYEQGNDFGGVVIRSDKILENARKASWPIKETARDKYLESPGGFKFIIRPVKDYKRADPVEEVLLASSDLNKTDAYWKGLLGMKQVYRSNHESVLEYDPDQTKLRFFQVNGPVNHAKAYGRVAFACPGTELPAIESMMKEHNHKILVPLVKLDTPGKATVTVVILADPDGHEICFVDVESFVLLSAVDPKADELLMKAIAEDGSEEWFKNVQGVEKPTA